ncbi:MAG TPA: DUF2252 family protein [Terriglobales bacterium]|nr:DUF2252 family protein [Terriglobales bacterium]
MNIVKATARYEDWLRSHTRLIEVDLRLKHKKMAESVFPFLRATFYRWAQIWPEVCPSLAEAPEVLAVGDLHVENFGTWRDVEGRLIWGVNDFDEAYQLSYTNDLVRLATSVILAAEETRLVVTGKQACDEILDGYSKCLAEGGQPFVLEEGNKWLRTIALNELRDPDHFWKKMDDLPAFRGVISQAALDALERQMPQPGLRYRLARRVAGLGSLGRDRFVAVAEFHGGKIAREAKLLVPSAISWARDRSGPEEIWYESLLSRAVRCPDPFVQLRGHWVVRRLSPHCSRIELAVLPRNRDECRLLFSMGWETANVHLGNRSAIKAVCKHLTGLKSNWLYVAARQMASAVEDDWQAWRKARIA